jgi:signal transduction histidine kinase
LGASFVVVERFAMRTRTERLIALGRAILATTSLLAIWLDPSEPARFVAVAYVTLTIYVLYSFVALACVVRQAVLPAHFGLVTHLLDLTFVATLQVFTDAVSSPFFAFMMFMIVSATLRWRWRGALWTGPMVLTVFLLLGVLAVPVLKDPTFEVNRFVIRTAYLGVAAAMMACLGWYLEDLKNEVAQLGAWPPNPARDSSAGLAAMLEHAARTLRTTRVALAWEEHEEPWTQIAWWSPSGFELRRDPPGALDRLVPEPLRHRAFLLLNSDGSRPTVIWSEHGRNRRWPGPSPSDLARSFGSPNVLTVPIAGERFAGYVFVLDKDDLSSDDFALADVVAQHLAASIERAHFLDEHQRAATMHERSRIAHDLHDGVLQSLTAIDLKLGALTRLVDQPVVQGRLEELRRIVEQEQVELRRFVSSMPRASATPDAFDLERELGALPQRFERQWATTMKLSVGELPRLGPALARQAYLIVREAASNAARHAKPSTVIVDIERNRQELRVVVTDNGPGFGFDGRYDDDELGRLGLGPASLRARVEALQGHMTIESSTAGARVEIALPLRQPVD